jgi:hypothetical protein
VKTYLDFVIRKGDEKNIGGPHSIDAVDLNIKK